MPPAFVLQIFYADVVQSNRLQWESSFWFHLCFNPVHTCPELFPYAHKVISKHFFLFKMRGTSFWLMAVLTAAVWQSHSRAGVEWVVEVIRKQGGAPEFWTGYERAEQHSQRLDDSLRVSSKWSGGWDQTKPTWSTPAEDALTVQKVLQSTHHLHNATHPIQLWSQPQIFIPLSPTLGPLLLPTQACLVLGSAPNVTPLHLHVSLLWDVAQLVPLPPSLNKALRSHQTPDRTLYMPYVKMRNRQYIAVLGWE